MSAAIAPLDATALRIAVIGAGPRGTVMLERICASAPELAPGRRIEVHVVDSALPGAGRVWRTEQNRLLLMNTATTDVSVFTDPSVTCEGPLRPGPTLYRWAKAVAAGEIEQPDDVVAEARTLQPWSYASRAFQGHYLNWAFRRIADTAPSGLSVHVHRGRALDVEDLSSGEQRVTVAGEDEPLTVDAVVLANGHFDVGPTLREQALRAFADEHGLCYVPPANPGEVDLARVPAGEPVVLRGLGLNFFDYVILLSAGRGGRFVRDDEGRLRYEPSGAEPVMYAGSGRGIPYTSRAEIHEEVVPRYKPRFLDADAIRRFRAHAGRGTLDFVRDVWPMVAKESCFVYYQRLLEARGDELAVERFTREYAVLDWDTPAMRQLIERFFPDPTERWDWESFDTPKAGTTFAGAAAYQSWVVDRLRDDVRHSRLGPAGSARKAMAAVVRDLRDEVRQVISHDGISGESYRAHIDGWFSGLANFVASGPPASRIEELVALADAGVVRFLGPRMRVVADRERRRFVVDSTVVADEPIATTALIEAHLPVNDVRRATDPLVANLVRRGGIRPHVIPNGDGTGYETGAVDIEERTHRVVRADGTPHPARFTYGPPVESVQWVTAIGARPYVNSRTLLQGDVIARGALAHAAARRPQLARHRTGTGRRDETRVAVAAGATSDRSAVALTIV